MHSGIFSAVCLLFLEEIANFVPVTKRSKIWKPPRRSSTVCGLIRKKFADKYGIEQLGLFGSVARGEQDEKSDIDVFITMSRPSFFTRMNIKEELQKLFHRKVDLITLHENMFRSFRQNLERDAIYI